MGDGPQDRISPLLFDYWLALPLGPVGPSMVAWPAYSVSGSHGSPFSLFRRTALLQARPRLLLPVQSLVCLAAFGLALPLAISLFPQMSEVSGGRGSRAGQGRFAVWSFMNQYLVLTP